MISKALSAALLALAVPAFSTISGGSVPSPALGQLENLAPAGYERPIPEPPRPVEIAVYETEEEFTFESDARTELDNRLIAFRNAGITVLGGRMTVKANRRHGFAVEYIPTLQPGTSNPPALLLMTYRSPASYWRESEAEEAMNSAASNLRSAGLTVAASALVPSGRDNAFEVAYFVPNSLRPSQNDEVRIEKHLSGKHAFESGAESAAQEMAGRFRRAGIPVLRTRAVRRPDRDYSVEIEYALRTNRHGARPMYAPSGYEARETFSFESGAQEAARQSLPAFSAAGVLPISAFVRKAGRDYSYGVDFLMEMIYRGPNSYPSVAVKTYQAQETFDFESQAQNAMREKIAAFDAAGLKVIGSLVVPAGRDYSYVLDYFAR